MIGLKSPRGCSARSWSLGDRLARAAGCHTELGSFRPVASRLLDKYSGHTSLPLPKFWGHASKAGSSPRAAHPALRAALSVRSTPSSLPASLLPQVDGDYVKCLLDSGLVGWALAVLKGTRFLHPRNEEVKRELPARALVCSPGRAVLVPPTAFWRNNHCRFCSCTPPLRQSRSAVGISPAKG